MSEKSTNGLSEFPSPGEGKSVEAPAHAPKRHVLSRKRREKFRAPAILVAERDALLRWAIHESLREAGYRLLPVSDSAHAKELIDGIYERFALAVIDDASWTMTDSEVLWLRERWPYLPILVLADESSPSLSEHVRHMRLADLLVKPFELADLVKHVRRLVARGRRAEARADASATTSVA